MPVFFPLSPETWIIFISTDKDLVCFVQTVRPDKCFVETAVL